MPTEVNRVVKRKRIYPDALPGDSSSFVDIPVITEITFRADGSDQYWETTYKIDNSGKSIRDVRVDQVNSVQIDGNTTDRNGNLYYIGSNENTELPISVERVLTWPVKLDGSEQYWQRAFKLDNKTGADSLPPHFSTHAKTHVTRYKNPQGGDSVWVDIELIDELTIRYDGSEQYWEYTLKLNHPEDTFPPVDDTTPATLIVEEGQYDDISDTSNGVDPPYRLDPFQNIVNASWNPVEFVFFRIVAFLNQNIFNLGPSPPADVYQEKSFGTPDWPSLGGFIVGTPVCLWSDGGSPPYPYSGPNAWPDHDFGGDTGILPGFSDDVPIRPLRFSSIKHFNLEIISFGGGGLSGIFTGYSNGKWGVEVASNDQFTPLPALSTTDFNFSEWAFYSPEPGPGSTVGAYPFVDKNTGSPILDSKGNPVPNKDSGYPYCPGTVVPVSCRSLDMAGNPQPYVTSLSLNVVGASGVVDGVPLGPYAPGGGHALTMDLVPGLGSSGTDSLFKDILVSGTESGSATVTIDGSLRIGGVVYSTVGWQVPDDNDSTIDILLQRQGSS